MKKVFYEKRNVKALSSLELRKDMIKIEQNTDRYLNMCAMDKWILYCIMEEHIKTMEKTDKKLYKLLCHDCKIYTGDI
jgi:hypothetical protein